ncbi:hypothetical protein LUZ61_021132 [Rhynchospora tenuis]|uniref:Protein kinase domain-containing protein n=1 Tax=Rhynchospora tenuis TaxID=198213 RepID=A0AAD5W9T6_9POAL|nr:hypothetical protein LUZ61_021132 [Rhynchospora tenuis]
MASKGLFGRVDSAVASNSAHRSNFINIDCGLSANSTITEDDTGLTYVSDDQFIDTGVNYNISSKYGSNNLLKQFLTVRSFPNGTRNCYTFRNLSAESKYLVRATFLYGNYDNKNHPPTFDIHLGVNYWHTVKILSSDGAFFTEIIATATSDYLQVCLIDKNLGTPFISTLELRQMETTLYKYANATQSLVTFARLDIGGRYELRYPQDSYDRIWGNYTLDTWTAISTNSTLITNDTDFGVPSAVMQTAAITLSTKQSLDLPWTSNNKSSVFYIILHISEIQDIPRTALREFDILSDGILLNTDVHIVPPKLDPWWISYTDTDGTLYNVSLQATSNSTLPPLLNAIEIYFIIPATRIPTYKGDVTAINKIKANYKVNNGWSGDPCVPTEYSWTGVTCTSDSNNIPRITLLDVTGNSKLSATLPSGLQKRNKDGKLTFRPNQNESHGSTPVINSPKWNTGGSNYPSVPNPNGAGEGVLNFENRQFSYNDLIQITNKFQNNIGTGGFGSVYVGALENGIQVAVKTRSHSSSQGVKEFLAEAQNLTRVHHKNLVTLIGYCMDGDCMALVYEYMQEGTLQDKLRDNARPLTWSQRIRIAYDSALGLEYLHKACNPPLIHRDVKTNNILLNANLEAKIADFGLSRAFDNDANTHVSTAVVGTPGYLDPEYYTSYKLSEKSDVFSFGVVLLEIITGHHPIIPGPEGGHVTHWVSKKLSRGDIESIIDPRMQGQYDINSVWKVTELARQCTELNSAQRPTMSVIVAELKESIDLEISTEGARSRHTTNSYPYNYSRDDNFVSDVSQNSAYEMAQMGGVPKPGPAAR